MSGIRKGGGRKPTAAPKPTSKMPKSSANGGGKKSSKSAAAMHQCFVKGCTIKCTSAKQLAEHYEKVFSTNEDIHVNALTMQLDPHFSDATVCQICSNEFTHSGLLLQHIFQTATSNEPPKGMKPTIAKQNKEMHATLFQSFVQELITMPEVGQEEATEYLLSLLVPEYDNEDEYEDDDDEENDLYEDDDDEDGYGDDEPSMEELAEFQEFLSMHGLDLDGVGGSGFDGFGGGPREKMAFMKEFMKGQMGGMDIEEDEEDEPRGKTRSKTKNGTKSKSTPPSTAGAGQPGDLKCCSCDGMYAKSMYSSAQIKKKSQRRCKNCVGGESESTPTKSAPHTSNGSSTSSSSAATAASSTTAHPASKPSASGYHHTLHQHHAVKHFHSNGTEIKEEPEEQGDGDDQQYCEDEDEDFEDEDEEEEDDDDEDEFDPMSMFFGGGGGRRRGPSAAAASRAARAEMNMYVIQERPGQQLTRDRRLRLKASESFPIRCWQPKLGEAGCHVCKRNIASRLVQGWKLACLNCASRKGWIHDDSKPDSDDEDEEHEMKRLIRLHSAEYVSFKASQFPNYRNGLTQCIRPKCASKQLLLVYDEHGDEFIICAKCQGTKQKLRYYDKSNLRLVHQLSEPITND